MPVEVAQIEAVDVPIRDVHGPDALRWFRLAVLFVILRIGGRGRLELRFAVMALDVDPVEQPESRSWIHPAEHDHVALHGLQEEPARVLGPEVVQVGNDRYVEAWLHDECCGERFFQGPLSGMLALGLR